MKVSNAISAEGTTPTAAPSSGSDPKNPPTRPVEGFALGGVSNPPDPTTHAYRQDLADAALAGRVIASHYAEPLVRHITADTALMSEASETSTSLGSLKSGEILRMLDNSRGWAWGYAPDGRVGYVRSDKVAN